MHDKFTSLKEKKGREREMAWIDESIAGAIDHEQIKQLVLA